MSPQVQGYFFPSVENFIILEELEDLKRMFKKGYETWMNYLMVVVWLRNVLHSLRHLHAWSLVGGSACLVQSYWKKDIWRTDFEMQIYFHLQFTLCFLLTVEAVTSLSVFATLPLLSVSWFWSWCFILATEKQWIQWYCYCCVAIFTKLKHPLLEGDQQDPRSQWNLQDSKRLHGSDRIHESAPTMLYK